MNRRALAFLMITWLGFVVFVLFFAPKQPPVDQANLKQELGQNGQVIEAQPGADRKSNDAQLDTDDGANAEKVNAEKLEASSSPPKVHELILQTIGSLDAKSPSRYLITVNPVGGAIRRVELNFRQAGKKSFKYRDLEDTAGYLGCLDCLDTPQGCLIRSVGHGTPAFNATASGVTGGVQAGDFLIEADGEPMTSAADFENWMSKTKAGRKIVLTIRRPAADATLEEAKQGQTIPFSVELIRKPIELLRPEFNEYLPLQQYPESFLLNLLQPMTVQDPVWPELDQQTTIARWKVNPISDGEIEVRYALDRKQLETMGFQPLDLIKRYRLPRFNDADLNQLDSKTFHFELDVEIVNASEQTQSVAYQLDGPSGTTIETWWYAQKIHGRSTAIGYSAGARDVIGSTQRDDFIFWGCPEIAAGAANARPFPQYVSSPHVNDADARKLNFVGVDAQYFNISLMPKIEPGSAFEVNSVTAFPCGKVPISKHHRLTNCTFQLFKTVEIPAGQTYRQTFEIFAGPKDKDVLSHYGLDGTRTFGWFAWLSKPLLWLLHFFYWITGSFSYGVAIVMLTVLVRSLMIPISRKAAINAQMMQLLQPQMQEIRERYKDNPEKQGVATRELFRKYRYNPLSGCFLGLLQLPIFLGLFRGLSVDIGLRDQPLISGMRWCSNLSGPDQLLDWSSWSWLPGFLTDKLGFFGPYLNILPLITVALFLVQQKMFMPPPTDDQQRLMQKMMTFMMIFMGLLFFKVAAGLCVYFITSSIWGILERQLLPKPTLDPEKFAAMETDKPNAGGMLASWLPRLNDPAVGSNPVELNRENGLAERKQKNAERKKRLKKRDQ